MDESIRIEKAAAIDIDEVAALYGAVCGYLASCGFNYCDWLYDRYPNRATAEKWVAQDVLYVLRSGGSIIASLALTHVQPDYYEGAGWEVDVPVEEVAVLHTIVTHPGSHKRGYSSRLLAFAVEESRRLGMKAVRLDVRNCNPPAIASYLKAGFRFVSMHEDTSFPPPYHLFRMYEYVL